MADGGNLDLVGKFKEFCSLAGAKDPCQMTSKACGKMVADCFDKGYKKYDVKSIVDASVFPACKEKGKPHMIVNKENCTKIIEKTAHEIAKRKTKNTKIAADDPEVVAIKADLCMCVVGGGPHVKCVKQSATGNVDKMTDASQYTGAHKERFDAEGKGKGTAGREEIVDNSGYVGNYKNKGSFDMKK